MRLQSCREYKGMEGRGWRKKTSVVVGKGTLRVPVSVGE